MEAGWLLLGPPDGVKVKRSMGLFDQWCDQADEDIGTHSLVLLTTNKSRIAQGIEALANAIPEQYVSSSRYTQVLERLGKRGAANYLRDKLPKSKTARSADLGEILALSFIEEKTTWGGTVKRLRWKDHREMPMRGDDLIAIRIENRKVRLLKGEAKSHANLSNTALNVAREALEANDGRPSPHALAFYADRLACDGRRNLAEKIDELQYGRHGAGIPKDCVSHMIFSLSGNDPKEILREKLRKYKGAFEQLYVGMCVKSHAEFVRSVFKKLISNDDS